MGFRSSESRCAREIRRIVNELETRGRPASPRIRTGNELEPRPRCGLYVFARGLTRSESDIPTLGRGIRGEQGTVQFPHVRGFRPRKPGLDVFGLHRSGIVRENGRIYRSGREVVVQVADVLPLVEGVSLETLVARGSGASKGRTRHFRISGSGERRGGSERASEKESKAKYEERGGFHMGRVI